MQLSTERILTTHAGSLPRPDDLAQMLYKLLDDKPVDQAAFDARARTAIVEVVARQQKIGIDVISDGEQGKVGFSNYVLQRMSGFEGRADFMAADFADAPGVAADAFGSEGSQHLRLPVLNGPIETRDTKAVDKEISDFKSALGNTSPDKAFIPAVTPGQVAFNFPNRHYKSHQQYIEAAAAALVPEYKAIVKAGFNLQLNSPTPRWPFTAAHRAAISPTPQRTWRRGSKCSTMSSPAFQRKRFATTSAGETIAAHITKMSPLRTSST